MKYPKRLIEVDLPIKRISEHARREKSGARQGHISAIHIWWARRPLAACRAVLCASLWPDPVDVTHDDVEKAHKRGMSIETNTCPAQFRKVALAEMNEWTAPERQKLLSDESRRRFEKARQDSNYFRETLQLRGALSDFIADFSNWRNASLPEYLATARKLTEAAHQALGGGGLGPRPLVLDPFAGGGAIPFESLRVGADVFASDLNPIPVLLNKVVLEYVPRFGSRLSEEVRRCGRNVLLEAKAKLSDLYQSQGTNSGATSYLWARTIRCEGPDCGAEVPLLRTNALFSKKKTPSVLVPIVDKRKRSVEFSIAPTSAPFATVKSGAATCPVCGYTTPNKSVKKQTIEKRGGAFGARLIALVQESSAGGKTFSIADQDAYPRERIQKALAALIAAGDQLPKVEINPVRPSPNARGLSAVTRYGMDEFWTLYTERQLVMLLTIRRLVSDAMETVPEDIREAVSTSLLLAFGRLVDRNTSLCRWIPQTAGIGYTFGRQALSMIWDFAEINPLKHSGGWEGAYEDVANALETSQVSQYSGQAQRLSATNHSLADDIVSAFVTDPPYYDAIPYADLSDFFYVWLRPLIQKCHPSLAEELTTPKEEEAIWNPGRKLKSGAPKDELFYEAQMERALAEGRRVTAPNGIGVVVFAHKSTAGWEALLNGLLRAGWVVRASWPIDTEREARTNAIGTASLTSSVHLVCRPREDSAGKLVENEVGDWRDVLRELPERIHEWMPRLVDEGVVGADAIFACLGPALEIFSRYSRVEKASGEAVSLRDYLEHVWATVSQEALSTIFEGASTEGFEPDSRLTAMWLWTLSAPESPNDDASEEVVSDEEIGDDSPTKPKKAGFVLEYDTARKIAQGLGAHLEDLDSLVEISGDTARLLPAAERTPYLFGKEQAQAPSAARKVKKKSQMELFTELTETEDVESTWGEKAVVKVGATTLDRIHQSMILFAAGRGEALRRFLVDDGAGKDQRFWRLANALVALYPRGTDERRWIEGVLARKKGLGL